MFKVIFEKIEVYSTNDFMDAIQIATKLAIQEQGCRFDVVEDNVIIFSKWV